MTRIPDAACGYQGFGAGDHPTAGSGCVLPKGHEGPCRSNARRRLIVTHTKSVTFDQAEVDAVWRSGVLPIPEYVLAGDEETEADARAIAVYTALDGSLLEVFLDRQDDDVSHEVEDYDPEA